MYRIKQILSLLIAVSLMITSNVYSLPQSKTTLRPPLATSKTAKDARNITDKEHDPAVRGAASVIGTISATDHAMLNIELSPKLEESQQNVSEVLTPAGQKQFKDLPINLFCPEGILSEYGVAGHYGIRRFNIFLDFGLLRMLSPEDKELYFSHEVYELIRIIYYGMEKFGDAKMKKLASEMESDFDKKVTMENALKWFKKFSNFNKTNGKAVTETLDELASFLDRAENRHTVEPLLSGIHRQAPELPKLVKAELLKQRANKPFSESGDYSALKAILLRMMDNTSQHKDSTITFLAGDTEVARLYRKLAGDVMYEIYGLYNIQDKNIFNNEVLVKVIDRLDILLEYEMEHPVRGAAGGGEIAFGADIVLTPEAKTVKIGKLREEALYAEKAGLWVFAYRRLAELERLNPSEPKISQRKQTAYQGALSQVGPLGRIALERGLIVLYDGIDHDVVTNFRNMHRTDAMSKATSNGSLIERAIKLKHYDGTIRRLAATGASIEDIFDEIVAKTLIRSGVEAMGEAHLSGEPAGVSIEIESHLDNPAAMSSRANELARMVGGTDMLEVTINKIPAMGRLGEDNIFKGPGINTIEEAIYNGLYPNITLVMCSRGQIRAVADAIARGLQRRVARLQKESVSNDDIIKELQGFKSYISYFISRVSGELAKNQNIAKKISEVETSEEKLALAYRFMDLACAFFVDANEIFVSELRKNGFGEFEKLGCPITIELDASTGEKELPVDSPVIKALTEGKEAIAIEELSQHMLIKGYKNNYRNWGYYVFRLARPGTADTIPIELYNLLKAGRGNDQIKAMTLQEAREALIYAEEEFGLNEQTWENMAAGLIAGGVKLFIKAEQTVRLEIAKILIDVAIGNEKYDYAVREIDKLHGQLVKLNKQGAIDDSLQKEAEALRVKINDSMAPKLASTEQQQKPIATVTTGLALKAAAEAAGTGTAIAGTGEKGEFLTMLDKWDKARGRKKKEPRKETLRLDVPTIPRRVPAAIAIGASL